MPPTIDTTIAVIVGSALAAAVLALWRWAHQLNKRIRSLEEGRLADERRHSAELRDMAKEVMNTAHEATQAMRAMAGSVRRLADGVCVQTDLLRRHCGKPDPQPQAARSDEDSAIEPKDRIHG